MDSRTTPVLTHCRVDVAAHTAAQTAQCRIRSALASHTGVIVSLSSSVSTSFRCAVAPLNFFSTETQPSQRSCDIIGCYFATSKRQ